MAETTNPRFAAAGRVDCADGRRRKLWLLPDNRNAPTSEKGVIESWINYLQENKKEWRICDTHRCERVGIYSFIRGCAKEILRI